MIRDLMLTAFFLVGFPAGVALVVFRTIVERGDLREELQELFEVVEW